MNINASGQSISIEYGSVDLPIARVDEAGNRTEYGYDTESRLTTVTNPTGAVWRYTYDPSGRLVEETDFDGRTNHYTYDAAGQLIAHTNAAGDTTHYSYDALRRVSERRVGDAVTRLQYDAQNRIAAVSSPDAVVTFERDEQGRVIAETINGRTVHTSYHDLLGTVEERVTPSGRSSRWAFDTHGHPASLATGRHLMRFGHDTAGREISRTVDEVVALRQSFDAAGRLLVQHIADAAERGFSYDATDRITAITDSLDGERSFTADEVGRIHTVATDGVPRERYDYDKAGNLVGAGAERWELDGTMLVRSDDTTFEYDEKGRLVARIDPTGTWHFTWNAEDQMVQAITPAGDRWHYRYDGFSRRIAKQRLAADNTILEEVHFAWAGDLIVEQTGTTGTLSWDYWPDGSAPVTQTNNDDKLHTIITDDIGTPTHLVESNGHLRWWSHSDLWGRTTDPTGTPLRFPGQYHDTETGLHYNRFRYYDPATARYLSPDPLGLTGGPNPTAYVNDPLTLTDPLGLRCSKDKGRRRHSEESSYDRGYHSYGGDGARDRHSEQYYSNDPLAPIVEQPASAQSAFYSSSDPQYAPAPPYANPATYTMSAQNQYDGASMTTPYSAAPTGIYPPMSYSSDTYADQTYDDAQQAAPDYAPETTSKDSRYEALLAEMPGRARDIRNDFRSIKDHLNDYKGLGRDPEVAEAFRKFRDQLTYELSLKDKGYSNAEIADASQREMGDQASPFSKALAKKAGFSIPNKVWRN
ncbi:MAG: hypothetical protein QOH73_2772, partial [Gaiellaceae bacterium]|nr:hypothetical protein [Gaiellaceae bacterium]